MDQVPPSVQADSYKAVHYALYPASDLMSCYSEFRCPFNKDKEDHRFVSYGMRYFVENHLLKQWTMDDLSKAELFYATHNAGGAQFPFPKHLFLKFIQNNNGYFPITLQALPEGTCAHIHTPIYQLSASGEYAPLATFLETILTHMWYPCTVATHSRRMRDKIEDAFRVSCDDDKVGLIDYKLHDFGYRGVTCGEQAIIGGVSHLLNFKGSDTMSACYYAQFALNGGKAIGESIPATEHSIMTAWKTELAAYEKTVEEFGAGLFACVMDSYDYAHALDTLLPKIKPLKDKKGGFMVMRPDSGDPVEAVLMALRAGEKAFGCDTNSKGYKVVRGAGVIQGDGINDVSLKRILDAVLAAGYSAESVAFGMGGGLLQKLNRDTMSFATKLSYVRMAGGEDHLVMKFPKTDGSKSSFPGVLKVVRNAQGIPIVYPKEVEVAGEDLLRVVYDCGPVEGAFSDSFDTVRERVKQEWANLPKQFDPISPALREKQEKQIGVIRKNIAAEKAQ